jgi:choline dehydrogenase
MLETRTAPTRPLEAAFLRAVEEVGLPVLEDMNSDPWHPGAAVLPMNVVDGARWNTAFAYLDAARGRRNLTIRADTIVDRVTFSGTAASGIIGRRDGAAEAWTAGTVVVCAGTYMTPAILQRSGIGPGPVLERLGIEPIVDLPGVGDHLRDHPMLDVSFIARDAAVHDGLQHVVLKSRSPLCRDEHWDTHVLLFAWRPTRAGTLHCGPQTPGSFPRSSSRSRRSAITTFPCSPRERASPDDLRAPRRSFPSSARRCRPARRMINTIGSAPT